MEALSALTLVLLRRPLAASLRSPTVTCLKGRMVSCDGSLLLVSLLVPATGLLPARHLTGLVLGLDQFFALQQDRARSSLKKWLASVHRGLFTVEAQLERVPALQVGPKHFPVGHVGPLGAFRSTSYQSV